MGEHEWTEQDLMGTNVRSLVAMTLDPEDENYESDEKDNFENPDASPEADETGTPIGSDEDLRLLATPGNPVAHRNEVVTILSELGWRIRTTGEYTQAVRHFQQAVIIGGELVVDGVVGPLTTAKLRLCDKRRRNGLPTASPHFSFIEFRCKCQGRYTNCARIWLKRSVLKELESYRAHLGHGFGIVSGCRCTGHNHDVHGATRSRHLVGDACDFPPEKSTVWFALHSLFDGRGFNPRHLVRHGDMRGAHVTWRYGS